MKKLSHFLGVIVAVLLIGATIQAQTLVENWGASKEYGVNWPVINTASTPAGNASMGDGSPTSGWSAMRGQFATMELTTTQALVVSGKLEFAGGGASENGYTPFRYSLTYQDSVELINQNTDSAKWVAMANVVSTNHDGYLFCPITGGGGMSNTWRTGAQGTVWTVPAGNWVSTNNLNAVALAEVRQAPRLADIIEGVYNFAISVQDMGDGTNEVRWYMVEENNNYWFGGTVIDSSQVSDKFNGIIFGLDQNEATQFNVSEVQVEMGDPIVVPAAPWQSYYVDQWGLSAEYSTIWPILNDSNTVVGDASMGGDVVSGWKGLQGGFGQDVSITTEKALILKGQIEFVGADAGNAYTPIRFALTYQDGSPTLQNALTDSAKWSHSGQHYGYGFHPRTGAGTMSNGAGGSGTVWTINNGNWASTWSNNGGPIAAVNQAPRNAEIIAGTYDFAISVQAIDDTTNEIRWYMIEENNQYWYGGAATGTATTQKFNSIIFGVNEVEWSAFNVIAMKVDLGDPVVVPEAPWQSYYVDQWGLSAEYSTIWPILNDSNTVVGDASMGGDVVSGWKGLQGGFGQDVSITTEKALILKGQIEFVGADAGNAYTPIRFALTYQGGNPTLQNALTDSAKWSHSGQHYGYGFHPRTGGGTMSNGAGGSGTVWTINNGNWASTWSNNGGPIAAVIQAPRNAEIIAGTYDFAISVRAIDDATNEIRWYMIEENNQYWYGGTVTGTATTQKFNSIIFGVNEVEWSAFNVIAMKVDLGDPIDVPEAPWQAFYIDSFAIQGERSAGWTLTPGEITGNATLSGTTHRGWLALSGSFGIDVAPKVGSTLVVTGELKFTGGGFDAWSSLRLGLFDAANASNEDGHSGYLLTPPSGVTDLPTWFGNSVLGSAGLINNSIWWATKTNAAFALSNGMQLPAGAGAGAGTYELSLAVSPLENGNNEIEYSLSKDDGSYIFTGKITDATAVTSSFNTVNFAFNTTNNVTTQIDLVDIKVDKVDYGTVDVESPVSDGIPTEYALSQNYPNPFNPSTTIEFALPKNSEVSLVVYDILGRVVAHLASGQMVAGNYKINFDASNLASGIYFYSLQAGDFSSVKKLMLLK